MTLTLDSFETQQNQLTLDKFKEAIPAGVKIGRKAVSQIAATRSLLIHHDEDEYRQTREMLLNPETRGMFATEQTAIRERMFQEASARFPEFAADPTIPVEDRMQIVQGATTPFKSPFSRTPNLDMLAEESLIAESEGESTRAAEMRFNMADEIQAVNLRKRRLSAAINALRLSEDTSTANMAVDVLELVAPLAEWVHIDRLLNDAQTNLGEGGTDFVALLGTQKQELYDMIRALPSTDREEFAHAIINLVKEHEDIVLPDGNDLMSIQTLERMLLDNNYSNFERWFDNATSILDFLFVGGFVRGLKGTTRVAGAADDATTGARAAEDAVTPSGTDIVLRDVNASEEVDDVFDLDASQWSDVTDMQRRARIESTSTDVVPTSPSQVVKDTNPEMSRRIHESAMSDETGEAAEALYGTNRTEAAAKDLLPEPQQVPGRTPNKVEQRPQFDEPANIREARLREGNTAVSRTEMRRVTDKLSENLRLQASNVVVRALDDGTFGVTARYNPLDAGFKSFDEAIDEAEFAFRNYGITRDSLSVMVRDGDGWQEVTAETAKNIPEGNMYSVGLNFNYRFRPEDLEEIDLLSTGSILTRVVDSMPASPLAPSRLGQGSLIQNFLDAASTIHPQIVNAASVAVDKTFGLKKLYVDLANEFSTTYSKLPKERRVKMTDYINEANYEGIRFDVTDLYSRGFSQKEVDALRQWRKANDAMWHATNADLVKTLRGRGYVSVVHKGNDTKLVGQPVNKSAVRLNDEMFDPADTITSLSRQEVDDLYENGGQIVKLNEPIQVDGRWVDQVISRNTVSGGYSRSLYDGETVLSYRDGYYPVMYDANYFITKKVRNADGQSFDKVVGSSRNRQDAEQAIVRLQSNDTTGVFEFRKDRRFNNQRAEEIGEEGWNLAVNSGLSSQRVRGQRLQDYSANVEGALNTNLKDPLEALANQISQVSKRVPMRHYLDTVKKRWMLNYGNKLDLPTNPKTGKKDFPSSVANIQHSQNLKKSFVADARTNYNYIAGLENGYINGIDEAYKGVLHLAADVAADLKLPWLEGKLLDSTALSPVQASKTAAFKMFLALNPARQAIVQRGQIIMLGAVNPSYVATGLLKDLNNINLARAGMKMSDDVMSLLKEVEEAGILQAVDAHNFIRQDLLRLADVGAGQKILGAANRPIEISQKVGFDLAEQDNLLAAWLAHRDLAIKAGRNLKEQRVREEILGDTRAFTLNMNRAGDQPYAQNTLSLAAQFLSFQHKALLQGLTNKSLSRLDRAKILSFQAAVFGVSASVMYPAYNYIFGESEPNETRDRIENGLLHTLLNDIASIATGEEQAVDWGDLAPVEAFGMGNVLVGMYSTDLADMISKSPAGSLLFGANPRVANVWKSAMRYFSVTDDYEDPELETRFSDVATSFLSLASGYSNFFKARYALQSRQKMSGSGSITDEEVTAFEAAMAAFGFQTETEVGYREVTQILYKNDTFTADDVRQWYTELKSQIARRGQSIVESDMMSRVMSEAWRVFGDDREKAAQEVTRMLQRDAERGDFTMLQNILRQIGYITPEDTWKLINALPPGQTRDRAVAVMQAREQNNEEQE